MESGAGAKRVIAARVLLWIARLTAIAAIVPLTLILFGEWGAGPSNLRGWIYLVLFPVGFSLGYLLGWRRPLLGGGLSLACMAASLVVVGRAFGPGPYLVWGLLSVPGILYVVAGSMLQGSHRIALGCENLDQ